MAFDSGVIACLVNEIKEKTIQGRVDKIYQPQKDEFNLYIRTRGKDYILVISLMSGSPRIYLSDQQKENPSNPPAFCILLRKYLSGAQVLDIVQPNFERMVVISFNSRDEMGFFSVKKLVVELMGKYTNLMLCDENDKILGVFKSVDFTTSEIRQILPGMKYELPPTQGKINPLDVQYEEFDRLYGTNKEMTVEKFLVRNFSGISPLVGREVSYRISGKTDCILYDISSDRLYRAFSELVSLIGKADFSPCALIADGKIKEFSFMEILQYGDVNNIRKYESPSKLMEECYRSKEHEGLVISKAHDIFRILTNAEKRLLKKIENQQKEIDECREKDVYKKYGDLITANLYRLKQGDESVTLTDYYSEDMSEITLKLDKRLSPSRNAQRFYKKYNKLKNAEIILSEQIGMAKRDLEYIYTVFDSLSRAQTPTELEEIREELSISGFASKYKSGKKGNVRKQKIKVSEYRTENGYTVLCGANNIQNDYLTFTLASKNDYWFHVKNAPGSHVILVCDKLPEPPAIDFTQAANIAAVNSKLSTGQLVTVDYTLVRNIKRPPASKPGYVTYSSNYSAYVTPDPEGCRQLKVK